MNEQLRAYMARYLNQRLAVCHEVRADPVELEILLLGATIGIDCLIGDFVARREDARLATLSTN